MWNALKGCAIWVAISGLAVIFVTTWGLTLLFGAMSEGMLAVAERSKRAINTLRGRA